MCTQGNTSPAKPLIAPQAVAAAVQKSVFAPVLARIGQKAAMSMVLLTCSFTVAIA